MATFELYLIADKAARKEVKNPFYSLLDDEAVVDGIFRDFGMDPATSRIICGHVPVKVKDGEDPVKAGGRVLCIDGGFSAAYQKTTGLAGFTLVSNAEGLFLDLPRRRRGGYSRHPCRAPRACRLRHAPHGGRHRRGSVPARTHRAFAHLALAARTPASMSPYSGN